MIAQSVEGIVLEALVLGIGDAKIAGGLIEQIEHETLHVGCTVGLGRELAGGTTGGVEACHGLVIPHSGWPCTRFFPVQASHGWCRFGPWQSPGVPQRNTASTLPCS